jgi:hypothetical protein
MSYKLLYLNYSWPDTNRKRPPEGATLEIHKVCDKWVDLVFLNERGHWEYISSLPVEEVDKADVKV